MDFLILKLHQFQYKIPTFFTFGLWILMFVSFLLGNSNIGWILLAFLIAKMAVQMLFLYFLINKIKNGKNSEEITAYMKHTRILFRDNGIVTADGQELLTRDILSERMRNKIESIPESEFEDVTYEEEEEDIIIHHKEFRIGDSVSVKPNVVVPDFPNFKLKNYQGRIESFNREDVRKEMLVFLELDSITLNNIPNEYLVHCEEEGFDPTHISLHVSDVKKAKPRDTSVEVKLAQERLEEKMLFLKTS